MEPRHFIRAAIAVSVAGHVALAVGVYFADARPFDPTVTENIAVDIVTPKDVAEVAEAAKEAEKTKPPEPEKQPDPFRLPDLTNRPTLEEQKSYAAAQKPAASSSAPAAQAAQQQAAPQQAAPTPPPQPSKQQAAGQPPSQQQASQQQALQQQSASAQPPAGLQQQAALQPAAPQPQPAPPQAEPDVTVKYGVMLGLPDGNGGSEALAKADIAPLDIAAFRRHLKSCLTLPAAVSRSDKVRIVLRAFLAPNGKLITEPTLIEASASAKGPLLMQAAMKALEACQPYAMLPADKYNEWKVLDLPFTPQDFAG